MPNPLNLSDAADLVDVSIQQIWLKGSEDESRMFEQYYNTETGVVDYYLKDSSLSGLGYAGRIVENAAIVAQSPVQGYDRTYTQVQFGVVMSFTKMMWFFGIRKRNLEQITQEARKACADLRELRCAERLVNSFLSTYVADDVAGNYVITVTGGDGSPFVDNAHTREDAGTNNNNVVNDGTTSSMDMDYDALKAAHRTAALVLNPQGKPMNISLDTLIVAKGYAVSNIAREILGAITKGWIPRSADRDGSAVPAYKMVEIPWILSNTSYWWMYDSKMKNATYGLQYKESQPIELEGPNIVFKTGEIQYKATMMFDIGFNDFRGWVGSANDNSTV